MDTEIKRDGIILKGRVETPKQQGPYPAVIMFHGFGGDLGYHKGDLFTKISAQLTAAGLASVRFDFNGHGKSEGAFSDMDVLRELEDAIEILKYTCSLDYISEVYVLGHSQGGVVGGLLSGLYPDVIKKLVLMAPAATLKEDAQAGVCMGTKYDTAHIPDNVDVDPFHRVGGHYFRIAKNLPIYELTSKYTGPALVLHGVHDEVVDVHASRVYREKLLNCQLHLFEHLNHGIEGRDQAEAIKEAVQFLRK